MEKRATERMRRERKRYKATKIKAIKQIDLIKQHRKRLPSPVRIERGKKRYDRRDKSWKNSKNW